MAWMPTTFIDTRPAHPSTRSPNGRRYSKALLVTTLLLGTLGLTRPVYAGGHTDESLEFSRPRPAAATQAEPPQSPPPSQVQPVTPPAEPSQERKACMAEFDYDKKQAMLGCADAFGHCSAREGCKACQLGVSASFESRRASACPMP